MFSISIINLLRELLIYTYFWFFFSSSTIIKYLDVIFYFLIYCSSDRIIKLDCMKPETCWDIKFHLIFQRLGCIEKVIGRSPLPLSGILSPRGKWRRRDSKLKISPGLVKLSDIKTIQCVLGQGKPLLYYEYIWMIELSDYLVSSDKARQTNVHFMFEHLFML